MGAHLPTQAGAGAAAGVVVEARNARGRRGGGDGNETGWALRPELAQGTVYLQTSHGHETQERKIRVVRSSPPRQDPEPSMTATTTGKRLQGQAQSKERQAGTTQSSSESTSCHPTGLPDKNEGLQSTYDDHSTYAAANGGELSLSPPYGRTAT